MTFWSTKSSDMMRVPCWGALSSSRVPLVAHAYTLCDADVDGRYIGVDVQVFEEGSGENRHGLRDL